MRSSVILMTRVAEHRKWIAPFPCHQAHRRCHRCSNCRGCCAFFFGVVPSHRLEYKYTCEYYAETCVDECALFVSICVSVCVCARELMMMFTSIIITCARFIRDNPNAIALQTADFPHTEGVLRLRRHLVAFNRYRAGATWQHWRVCICTCVCWSVWTRRRQHQTSHRPSIANIYSDNTYDTFIHKYTRLFTYEWDTNLHAREGGWRFYSVRSWLLNWTVFHICFRMAWYSWKWSRFSHGFSRRSALCEKVC